jgi:hypothetical protein
MHSPSRETDGMSKRAAPKSTGSYSNSWDGQDVPSYVSQTSPPPSTESDIANSVETKIKKLKRRRPTVVQTRSSEDPISKLYNRLVHGQVSNYAALSTAVLLWYLLGVLSIGTTKLLLNQGVPPLYLTLQQLFLGSNFLRFLLEYKAFGSAGLAPWPVEILQSPVRRTFPQNESLS